MSLQLEIWIQFYLDAECHFFHTVMDFFEDYNHTVNSYQLQQPTSGFLYYSKIYCDFLARVEQSQGRISSLIHGGINPEHFQPFITGDAAEPHLFALAFAYWWNMTEIQKQVLAASAVETDWRKLWDILNYFLCNPKMENLPSQKELRDFRYHGAYWRWSKNDSPQNGVWVTVEHPEEIFL